MEGNLLNNQEFDLYILMKSYFLEKTEALLEKLVKRVVRRIRQDNDKEINLLNEDYNLNFFEQVCVILDAGNSQHYFFLDEYIELTCESIIDNLSTDENNILFFGTEGDILETLILETRGYLGNYENKRIERARDFYY